MDGRLHVLPTMIFKWIRKLDLEGVLGGAWVCEQLNALLNIHDRVDWPQVPNRQGHHYDRADRANAAPRRRDDAGEPSVGNWIRFDPGALESLQPEFMQGGTVPVATATAATYPTREGQNSAGQPGGLVPPDAPLVGEGPMVEEHPRSAMPEEESGARRRVFAELGVSEDELLKLVNNTEFVAGVKRLKTAADAGVPRTWRTPRWGVTAPAATTVEGDPLDSEEG